MRVILNNLITAIEADGTIITGISWNSDKNELNLDVDPIGEDRARELIKRWFDRDPYSGADLLEEFPQAIEPTESPSEAEAE